MSEASTSYSRGETSPSRIVLRPLEMATQPLAQIGEVFAAEQAPQPLLRRPAHCGANLRSGSASRTLARPSQVQRET
jgi:hypothetical protein